MTGERVTVERLERAIAITAECMVRHHRPRLITIMRRLEAERDRLMAEREGETAALDYARRILDLKTGTATGTASKIKEPAK